MSAFYIRPKWPVGCLLAASLQMRLDPLYNVHALNSWLVPLLGHTFQVIFCCDISYNSPNSSTLSTRKLSTNRYDKCCCAEISTLIAAQGSCMSHFCPSYAAYSVTVSCRIALFQQLVYCIGADSVNSADSTDSAISVTLESKRLFRRRRM